MRLDLHLKERYPAYSRGQLQRQIAGGAVLVDGSPVLAPSFDVTETSAVLFTEPAPDPLYPEADPADLKIIFEDEHIVAVDKPVGMITHPNSFKERGTLVQALMALYPQIRDAVYDPENPVSRMRPGIAHRLDKDTGGVIVAAKTRAALLGLAGQFQEHRAKKTYQAYLLGELTGERRVDAPIKRKPNPGKNLMVASHDKGQGRNAVSVFRPMETAAPYAVWPEDLATRVDVGIETGRTHQIRVHAKFIGHPVLGDAFYGNQPSKVLSERLGYTHQMLRAVKLELTHPVTGEALTLEAPGLPPLS